MAALDAHFSTFINGGDLVPGDTVVGLRNGLNTKFNNTGGMGTFLPLAGGTMSGSIDMDGNAIINLPAPGNPLDATNKAYVDSLIAGASPLTTKGDLYTFTTVNARLAVGTINGQMLQVDSGTATGLAWSTATYPASTTVNRILFSSSNNVIGQIATGNDGTLITSGAGVPSISSTLPLAVQNNITVLGTQAEALDMGTHLINNVSDPVSNLDAANKQYVDQTALNGTSVYAVSAASLGTVTQSGAGVGATLTNAGVQATFALDGVTPPVGVNVLIKNTAVGMTSANEGIYTVIDAGSLITNWILRRATSYDTALEINETGLIVAQNGSTLAGTAWYNAATIVTVDTTAFSYSQFGNIIFPLTLSQGGTGASLTASNGGIVYSNATTMAILAGIATASHMLLSGATAPPTWSTSTIPTSAGAVAGKFLASDGTNYVLSSYTLPTSVGATGSILRSDGTNFVASTSLWPNTVGSAGKIIRSDGTTNAYTTATFADTYAASDLLYSNGANTVQGLTKVNSAVLLSTSAGVPTWSGTMTNGQIIIGSTGATPVAASLSAGTGITITPGAGTITIAATGASSAINQVVKQVFTADGTFTPTSGMVYCIIEAVGSGGGGGGCVNSIANQALGGGGGGAGSYARLYATAATIGASKAVTIGAGGTAGANTGGTGGAGGDAAVTTICVGKGGSGGIGIGTPPIGGAGGVAGTGDFTSVGNGGGAGIVSAAVGIYGFCGQGAASHFGGQPVQTVATGTTATNGANGGTYGAGANGGLTINAGGAVTGGVGGKGVVIITEYLSV